MTDFERYERDLRLVRALQKTPEHSPEALRAIGARFGIGYSECRSLAREIRDVTRNNGLFWGDTSRTTRCSPSEPSGSVFLRSPCRRASLTENAA